MRYECTLLSLRSKMDTWKVVEKNNKIHILIYHINYYALLLNVPPKSSLKSVVALNRVENVLKRLWLLSLKYSNSSRTRDIQTDNDNENKEQSIYRYMTGRRKKIKKAKKKKRLHLQKQKALHHMLNVLKSFSVKQYKNTSSGNGIVKRCNFTSAP